MKRKGFTLIELLAVIVILAVIALIATPIVLNVIENAKEKSNMNSAYGLIDAGRLYYSEALLNEKKAENIKKIVNIWDEIAVSGSKPSTGELYVNESGEVALSVVFDKKCYQKTFIGELAKIPEEDCGLNIGGPDGTPPNVVFTPLGQPFNELSWAKEDFYIKIEIQDSGSGGASYKWCSIQGEQCNPETEQNTPEGSVSINLEGNNNRICVIGVDLVGNTSKVVCSDPYKLDKTLPNLSGIGDFSVAKDAIVNLEDGVVASDVLSGVKDNYDYAPKSVDTSKASETAITYTVTDQAGNSQSYIRKIRVETVAPTVTFEAETGKINNNGWAHENYLVTFTSNDQSGLGMKDFKWCQTTGASCDPSGNTSIVGNKGAATINTESASNRICVIATDNHGKISSNICSDAYKLDKTAPTFQGVDELSIGLNDEIDEAYFLYDVTASDRLSGVDGTLTHTKVSVDTSKEGTTPTSYQVKDKAGNVTSVVRNVIVKKFFIFDSSNNEITGYDSNFPWFYMDYHYFMHDVNGEKWFVIPDTIDGVPVERIGNGAFDSRVSYRISLGRIKFPESVYYIGDSAFRNCGLSEIILPSVLTYIGGNSFSYNYAPEFIIYARDWEGKEDRTTVIGSAGTGTVNIPSGVTTIASDAFVDYELRWVTLPFTLKTIESRAFQYNMITDVTIPPSVTKIGNEAFHLNTLTEVRIMGKSSPSDFEVYGSSLWGSDQYGEWLSEDRIIWNAK